MSDATSTKLPETTTIDISGQSVVLPNRFAAMVGQPLTDDFAKIIFAHVAGQFRNNQVANAKARADRYGKAKDDAERAANAPMSADDYLKLWSDYLPNVGRTESQSQAEKNRYEAARRVWIALVNEHNDAIKNGGTPVLKSANQVKAFPDRPTKTKDVSTEQHTANVEAWEEKRRAILDTLLRAPAYADRIQSALEAVQAEQGKAKATAEAVPEASADLI